MAGNNKYGTGSSSDRVVVDYEPPYKHQAFMRRSVTRSLQLPVPYSSTSDARLFAEVLSSWRFADYLSNRSNGDQQPKCGANSNRPLEVTEP